MYTTSRITVSISYITRGVWGQYAAQLFSVFDCKMLAILLSVVKVWKTLSEKGTFLKNFNQIAELK